MNRDEIMNMQPGVELDKLVAAIVMGWEIRKIYKSDQSYHEFYFRNGQQYENVNYPSYWQPSKYIDAAWEVVEKVGQNKFNIEVIRRSDGKWFVSFKKVGRLEDRLFEVGDTADNAPEAICRAALLSLIQEDTP